MKKTRRKIEQLYEPRVMPEKREDWDLIYVLREDVDGYFHYYYCGDPTRQEYAMTDVELHRDYIRMN